MSAAASARSRRERGFRTCPVPGCERKHKRSLLMCGLHWRDVPKPLRDEVWRTYRELGVHSDEYWEARDAAIESVTP